MPRMLWILSLLLVAAGILFAGTTGKVTGTVKDKTTGEPLIGVNVVLDGTALGASTDLDGRFVILNVPPGKYTVTFSMIGYSTTKVSGVAVNIDLTTTVDRELSETVVDIGQVVEVIADRPLVKKDLTSSEARVDADQLRTMPVQEVNQVLSLQSGITVGRGGELHIRGGRANEVAYWVDGIPMSDAFDGSLSVVVENNAVQELQVISGTFNAEYGQAMSGLINIVTKDGGSSYSATVTAWSGDYMSGHSSLFYNIGDVSALANKNLEANLSGPIPGVKDLTFYVSGRNYITDGWLYGTRRFLPTGGSGDGEAVPMNWRKKLSGQFKLSYRLIQPIKISVGGLFSKEDFRNYNHSYRLNPDGDINQFDRGETVTGTLTHTLGSASFYTLNVARYVSRYYNYLYQDPLDPRYLHPDSLNEPAYSFLNGGTNLGRYSRITKTWLAKFDFTSQMDSYNQVKLGLEAKNNLLYSDSYSTIPKTDATGQQIVPFSPAIPTLSSAAHERLKYAKPLELAVYGQDKIEFMTMIINVGIRLDYFDSRGNVLADPEDPNIYNPFKESHKVDVNGDGLIDRSDQQEDPRAVAQRAKYWYKRAKSKLELSPRFGIAYPITDRGIIHFSYGHFLQIPPMQYLFSRPGFKVTTAGGGAQGVFGNADLEPQKTVMYEIGLQQQLTDEIGFDLTGFYRDVRNWVTASPPIQTALAGVSYVTYANKDYANVRGITFSITKRLSSMYAFSLAYTYQVAEGNNSNPEDEYYATVNNSEPVKQLSSLDWDQRHTLNASLMLGGEYWGASVIGRYGSGLPYTPDISRAARIGQNVATDLLKNSRRRPTQFTLDSRVYYTLRLAPLDITVFAQVYNLLDERNEAEVYTDTGRATYTLQEQFIPESSDRNNTVAEWFKRPDFFSEPRSVQVGLTVGF